MAGIDFSVALLTDGLNLSYSSYNVKVEKFLTQLFQQFQNFSTDQVFFENLKLKKIRVLKNSLTVEPYERLGLRLANILNGNISSSDMLEFMPNVTYEKFLEFKTKFVQRLRFKGLIQGHLSEEEAVHLSQVILSSLQHKPLPKEEVVEYYEMAKIPDKTVY